MSKKILFAGLADKEEALRDCFDSFDITIKFYDEDEVDQMPVAAPELPAVLLMDENGVVVWSIMMDAWDDIDNVDDLIDAIKGVLEE